MAAAYPIPSFLQLPIEGVADEEADAGTTERARPRNAALVRNGSLRLTHPVRLAPDAGHAGDAGGTEDAGDAGGTADARDAGDAGNAGDAGVLAAVAAQGAEKRPAAIDREAAIATWRAWLKAWDIDADPAPVVDALVERLDDPRRCFHNLERVAAELAWLDTWRDSAQDPVALGFATWFRYAILDPARCDNEARSAEFARIGLAGLGVDTQRIRRVRELIVATRQGAVAGTPDAKLLVDIGRSYLADLPRTFDAHEDDLRAESVHVVDAIYWRRRIAAIRAMLIKPRVYLSDVARSRLEAAARGNLSRRLDAR